MKIGDKVKVESMYSMDCNGAVGIVVGFHEYYIGVQFKQPHAGTHSLNGVCPNEDGRWYPSDKLKLIKEYTTAREMVMF